MSLRVKIHLLLVALLALFFAVVVAQQIQNTRRSVHEEVLAANRVAAQLLTRVSWVYEQSGVPGLADFLTRLGRLRANELLLYDAAGQLQYQSPASPYKAGRWAPEWFAAMVTPPLQPLEIAVTGGRMVVRADASRAALDGWDDLKTLLELAGALFVAANLLVYWIAGRALRPLGRVIEGLLAMERGDYRTRLPPLAGKEAQRMGAAFNRMAQSVEESDAAKRAAAEAAARLADSREMTQVIQQRIEEERRAIARELHDELGQSVTAIKSLALSIAQRTRDGDVAVGQAAQLIVDTAGRIYDVMHGMIPRLRPLALDNLGLGDALGDLVDDWRLQQPAIEFVAQIGAMPDDLGESLKLGVYRIAQEALTNAVRHAQAGRIEMTVAVEKAALRLRVRDDGRGLAADWQRPGHFGVRGMRERAGALGGVLEVASSPGGGTEVAVRIPLAEAGA